MSHKTGYVRFVIRLLSPALIMYVVQRPKNVVYYVGIPFECLPLFTDHHGSQSADFLTGPWSIASYLAPPGTRTYNTQSGWNIRVKGTKQTCAYLNVLFVISVPTFTRNVQHTSTSAISGTHTASTIAGIYGYLLLRTIREAHWKCHGEMFGRLM